MTSSTEQKIPVTVISGFLGSGKTTLLKRLLKNDMGLRIAVIENEFADETGIEKTIATRDATSSSTSLRSKLEEEEQDTHYIANKSDLFIELSNGCLCCSVRDSLVATIENLIEKRSRFDHIVIETSGLADPGPLSSVFWLDEELDSQIELNGVVTVVDALNFARAFTTSPEFRKQIGYADRVIINKIDKIAEGDKTISEIEDLVRTMNPLCEMTTATYCEVPVSYVFSIGTLRHVREQLEAFNLNSKEKKTKNNDSHDTSRYSSLVLREPRREMDSGKFRLMLGEWLWEGKGGEGVEIYRIKGVLNGGRWVVQAVFRTFDMYELEGDGDAGSKVVVIGKGLDNYLVRLRLEAEFEACFTAS